MIRRRLADLLDTLLDPLAAALFASVVIALTLVAGLVLATWCALLAGVIEFLHALDELLGGAARIWRSR